LTYENKNKKYNKKTIIIKNKKRGGERQVGWPIH
jgi:hypothetical protein